MKQKWKPLRVNYPKSTLGEWREDELMNILTHLRVELNIQRVNKMYTIYMKKHIRIYQVLILGYYHVINIFKMSATCP